MAAVYASLLAKDINNNILAALPAEKMSTQVLYNQRSIVQPRLISDLEDRSTASHTSKAGTWYCMLPGELLSGI